MAESDHPVRLSVIGTGIMGERMLRAVREQARGLVEVVSAWDASGEAMERVAPLVSGDGTRAARPGSARDAMEGADCVYVATPPATHLDYAEQALAAGKAVLLEKPLATDVPAADAFVRRHDGARVAVNFPFASSFAAERLQGWLDEGAVGAPRHLAIEVGFARWPRAWQQGAASWLDGAAEGGFTREVVSHFLFLARRMLGRLQLRTAGVVRTEGGTERRVTARLEAGGLPVSLDGGVGTTERGDANTWTLTGTGAIRLRDWSLAERQRPDGTWAPDPDARSNEEMRPLVLRRQLEGVASMVRGGPHRLATLQEALEVQAVVEAMLSTAPPRD